MQHGGGLAVCSESCEGFLGWDDGGLMASTARPDWYQDVPGTVLGAGGFCDEGR